jgi:hypothetical protein
MRFLYFIVFFFFQLDFFAQSLNRNSDIPVSAAGELLSDPWAGGLNSCQVSTFDANLDGVKDLFIFDRNGGKISIYINTSSVPGTFNYRYTQEYNNAFPPNLRNWVLLRDMNCDGKEDICANSGSGFKIYRNISETSLAFDFTVLPNVQAYYQWDGSAPLTSGVFCISPDVPAIDDYDNDGDMDMWSWNEFSSSLYFYKNMAIENGNCSQVDFKCRNRCYGKFGESVESFTLILGSDFECDFNVLNPREDEEPLRHTGGTTALYDLDNNGLKDLIIGDVSANSLTAIMLVESTGGQDSASFVHYDFPAAFGNGFPANMITFLGSYFIDVNNDGITDLVVSPNADNDASDKSSLLLYINEGSNEVPIFTRVQDNFLQDNMIDLGVGAYPTLGDVDGDGLTDMIVANRKRFSLNESYTSRLHFFKNIGTTTQPAFDLIDTNFLNIPSLQLTNIHPALGDLDADGDLDLLVGDLNGILHRFTNVTQSGTLLFEPVSEPLIDAGGISIDVGQSATPQVFDVDNDGKSDLIIGCLNGSVFYYRNIGTPQIPIFEWQTDSLGQAVASSLLGIQGKSVPCMYRTSAGETHLLLGTETGRLMQFSNIDGNLQGTFTLTSNDFEQIREGARTALASADLNNDGFTDFVVGNNGGGLAVWMYQTLLVNESMKADEINLFPNPASTAMNITLSGMGNSPVQLSAFDQQGRLLLQQTLTSPQSELNVESLSPGCYLIRLVSDHWVVNKRVVIKR